MVDVFSGDQTTILSDDEIEAQLIAKFGDPKKIARAKFEADKHIQNLESELSELRGEVKTRVGLEEFLTKIQNKPQEQKPPNEPVIIPPPAAEPVDIERLVSENLSKIEQSRSKQTNREKVSTALEQVWGIEAPKKLEDVAKSLNLSREALAELAERSPEAFFRVTGINTEQKPTGTLPTSTVTFNGKSNSTVRNKSYYDNLKKTNPNLYFEPKTQLQKHNDAYELKDEFWK